jgi:hypothetical protein
MGKVIPFVSKSDGELARLIREARAIYNSVFPSVELASEKDGLGHILGGADTYGSDVELLP